MSIKIPGVLSFQRGTIVTDGIMRSIIASSDGTERFEPVRVIRHGIRGTNINPKDGDAANIQRTESAKTNPRAGGLEVAFSMRTIPARSLLFGCSDPEFRVAVEGFIDRFFVRGIPELEEVCLRYARNILNGRWLWRNRILGDVSVTAYSGERAFSGQGSRLRDFIDYTQDEKNCAEVLVNGFVSQGVAPALQVKGRVMFGFTGEVEVFPSQNMVTNKPKGFARSLYKVDMISRRDMNSLLLDTKKGAEDAGEFMADMIDMGHAALRDQKIGNAIRTIDTWYPGSNGNPIPVEPNGASLEANFIFRKKGTDANTFLTKIDELKPDASFNSDAAFLIAVLVRGGVFSEKQ